MRVLVTGGAGFIGSHVVEALLSRGDEVVCYDSFTDFYAPRIKRRNLADALTHPAFRLIEEDILNEPALLEAASGCEAVVHLAAFAGVRPSLQAPRLCARVNVEGTINVLEAAAREHREGALRNLVFASSSSVYGLNSTLPFSEDQPLASPISPYAATKIAGEGLCHVYSHTYGLPVTCLRLFTVYGPRQRPEMAVHKFTRLMDEGAPIEMYGDGTSTRDYTYVSDVVSALLAALGHPLAFEVINLGNSRQVRLCDVIELIRAHLERVRGRPVVAHIRTLPDQQGDVPDTFSDIRKAQHLLGYSPAVTEEDGIAHFVDWYAGGGGDP